MPVLGPPISNRFGVWLYLCIMHLQLLAEGFTLEQHGYSEHNCFNKEISSMMKVKYDAGGRQYELL